MGFELVCVGLGRRACISATFVAGQRAGVPPAHKGRTSLWKMVAVVPCRRVFHFGRGEDQTRRVRREKGESEIVAGSRREIRHDLRSLFVSASIRKTYRCRARPTGVWGWAAPWDSARTNADHAFSRRSARSLRGSMCPQASAHLPPTATPSSCASAGRFYPVTIVWWSWSPRAMQTPGILGGRPLIERIATFSGVPACRGWTKGMVLTGRHLFRRKITIQFPEEKKGR